MLLPSYHLMSKRKTLRLAGFCNLNKTALVKNQTTKFVMTINLPSFLVGGVLFVCLFVCLYVCFLAAVSQMHSNLWWSWSKQMENLNSNKKLQKVSTNLNFRVGRLPINKGKIKSRTSLTQIPGFLSHGNQKFTLIILDVYFLSWL